MNDSGLITQPVETPVCEHCGGALPADSVPLERIPCPICGKETLVPGMLQQQYRICSLIGKGGMGAVYEAYDVGLDRKVAIKVVLREKALSDPEFAEAFLREARSVSKLVDEHVVVYYMTNTCEGQPFLVMELVKADSLDRMMKSGPVNAYTALDIGCQTAQGLRAANSLGLVHGDVKPDNILINAEHKAKIADFGIAAVSGARSGSGNEVWGTPYYIAPETLRKQKIDCRADIYSLGATLYHAIASIPPFEGADEVEVMQGRLLGPARPLTDVAPSCPEAIAKIIMRMLEADPIRRYPNYESLISDMQKVLGPGNKAKTGMHKRLVIKTRSGTVQAPVSQPMPSVTDPSAETSAPGLSKSVIIGLLVGGTVTVLTILGTGLWLLLRTADKDLSPSSAEASAARDATAQAAIQQAAAQALTEARAAIAAASDAIGLLASTAATRAGNAENEAKHMAQQARRATLEEHTAWLEPNTEKAPTDMLIKLQQAYKDAAAIREAANAAQKLRSQAGSLQAAANEASATPDTIAEAINQIKTARTAYETSAAGKAAPTLATSLHRRCRSWKHTVQAARREMEETVKARFAAEQKAKAEREKTEAAERLQEAIAEETASVATFEQSVAAQLDSLDTKTALKEILTKKNRLKYKEAKDAANTVIDRVKCLDDLKSLLITDANAGTLSGFSRLRSATDTTVTLGNRELTWKQFCAEGQVELVKIFTHRIADAAGSAGLSAGQRSELAVAARIFITRYVGSEALAKSKILQKLMNDLADVADALPGSKELRIRTEQLEDAATRDETAE